MLSFNFLDFYLSISFLRLGIISINYYWKVSEKVYRWNFCPLAKALNTSAVVVMTLLYVLFWKSTLFLSLIYPYQIGLIVLKIWSIQELEKIARKSENAGGGI